jgi:hypothetical protein
VKIAAAHGDEQAMQLVDGEDGGRGIVERQKSNRPLRSM